MDDGEVEALHAEIDGCMFCSVQADAFAEADGYFKRSEVGCTWSLSRFGACQTARW